LVAEQAARIVAGILEARSPRLSEVAQHMPGTPTVSYKAIQRFIWQAFADIKDLLGDKPLVLDRDFSYLELLQYCVESGINFVIRLNMRSQPPKFYTAAGREVVLSVGLGQKEVYQNYHLHINKISVY
jgi:hypothetical protein